MKNCQRVLLANIVWAKAMDSIDDVERPLKKRPGGQRQRLAKEESTYKQAPVESHLATMLMEKWSWGEMSPQAVQSLAAASVKDMTSMSCTPPEELLYLSRLGSSGLFPNNMHGELLRFATKKSKFDDPYCCFLPFKAPWNKQSQTLMLPHVVFSNLFHKYPGAFKKIMAPDENFLLEFWELQKGHPAYQSHPEVGKPGFDPRKAVPLCLHGDGTPVVGIGKIWARMMTTWCFFSMACRAALTKEALLPIWFLFDETESDTTTKFYELLCWSFNWLQKGIWPDVDHTGRKLLSWHMNPTCVFLCPFVSSIACEAESSLAFLLISLFISNSLKLKLLFGLFVHKGLFKPRFSPASLDARRALKPLAGGFKGILWSLVGDLEYMSARLGLPHYGLKKGPCGLCQCSGDEGVNSWKDCRLQAPWVQLQWTPESWEAWEEKSSCPLFGGIQGLTALNCSFDYMHCKYLGVDMIQFGSVLFLMVYHILPSSPLDNVKTCWKHILQSYKELGVVERYRGMRKLSLFTRKTGPPKLKGRASQIAALGQPLLKLWLTFMNHNLDSHKKIKVLLQLNCAMEGIMKECQWDVAFAGEAATKFIQFSFSMCQIHRELGVHFEGKLFSELPKMHHLLHCSLQCKVLSPRLTWCFRGEDLQKVSRSLASSCAKGLQGPQVVTKMLAKLKVAWHLKLSKMEE